MQLPTLQELLESGAHFGHNKELTHPIFKKYIFIYKDEVNIINLEKTQEEMTKVIEFLKESIKGGKKIVFVGTKTQTKEPLKELAESLKMPYVNYRWLGGTLTNYDTIKRRIKDYAELDEKIKSEEFKKLIKKEQVMAKKELAKFDKFLFGLKEMTELPKIMFVVDPNEEHVAVAEAIKMKIPVVALCNTNCDISRIDYVIPANDNAPKTIKLILSCIANNLK